MANRSLDKHRGRIYRPTCRVCQFMKRNPTFRDQVQASSYMDPLGAESLMEVVHRWGDPFPAPTMYSHMRRHQTKAITKIEDTAPVEAIPIVDLEEEVVSHTAHERGLDEIISKGRQMVRTGDIKINATALLAAIKTKADIEKSTKDRRLEGIKLFTGAYKPNNGPREDSSGG
jgi:hypothetical protein